MIKIIKTIPVTLMLLVIASSALAATDINLSPSNLNLKSGEVFNLNITVSPQNLKNYTVKAELKYPAQLMEVTGFKLADKWVALNQPSYNLVDNSKGILIKTAGYPKGFNTNIVFGTVTFKAKKSGIGAVLVSNGSLALDTNNKNVYSGQPASASLTIESAIIKTASTPKNIAPEDKLELKPEPKIIETEPEESSPTEANVIGFLGVSTENIFLALFASVLIVYILHLYKRGRKQNRGRR